MIVAMWSFMWIYRMLWKFTRAKMADVMETDQQQCKVFIVHSSKDKPMVENTICPRLIELGINAFYDKSFIPGRVVVENIAEAVYHSDKTLIYLTKNSLQSTWCRLELVLALEKTQKTNIHSVVLLVHGLSAKQVETLSFLRIAPKVEIIDGDLSWLENLRRELKAEVPVSDVLPAGNVAHGQAWSHYNGFLQYVLPDIEEKIKKCKWYKENPKRMPTMIFELIPQSAKCPSKVSDIDRNITHVGDLEPIIVNRAGNFRKIVLPVYSVTDTDRTVYYCVCEYPAVIHSIYLMELNNLASITKGERRLQLVRFYYTLNAIFHHAKLENGLGRGKPLLFNDEEESSSAILLREIKRESTSDDTEGPLARLVSQKGEVEKVYGRDVFICHCKEDRDTSLKIKEFLKMRGFRCAENEDYPGSTILQCIQKALDNCRWFILIYSHELHHTELLTCECLLAIQQCVYGNNICFIPVLKGVEPTEVPDSLSWITFIQIDNDTKYLENIEKSLRNVPIELETMMTAGNVSDGLAWAYVVNYLQFILCGLSEKIKEIFKDTSYVCPERLFVLCPLSCKVTNSLKDSDERISNHKHVIVHSMDQTGMKGREYHCDIYKIKEYYFMGQFAAPIKCLHEMYESRIAGLKEKEMLKEARDFFDKINRILASPAFKEIRDKCVLLFYDDIERKSGDVVIEQIENYLMKM